MEKHIYIRDEFLAKVNAAEKDLKEWEALKLITPSGVTDDQITCYSEDAVDRVRHIQKLLEMGYALEDIQKIMKRVGLPKTVVEDRKAAAKDQYLTVGNLAESVGVSPRTIKHWEDKGIIEPDMRSEGGFRLYSDGYVYLCKLITDLQHFGYTLEQIKTISDYFREFLGIQEDLNAFTASDAGRKMDMMLEEIATLFEKMNLLKEGIQRWEDLLKKKRREIMQLKNQNQKRLEPGKEKKNV